MMDTLTLSASDAQQLDECLEIIEQAKRNMVNGAVTTGLALIRVRKIIPKAEFLDWVFENCGYSKSSAYRYIDAAEAFGTFSKVENIQDSALYLLAKCEPAAKKAKALAKSGKRITHELAKELIEQAREKPAAAATPSPKIETGASQVVTMEGTPNFTCRNCGGHETDADGDCLKCHEPAALAELDPESEGGYEPSEARKPLDKLKRDLDSAARACKDAQKILPNCVHLADCFTAIDQASQALHRSRSSFKRRPK